jgi:hypothetical protein
MITKADTVRLSHFKVRLPDGGDSTSALYANNSHQCLVIVEVAKETRDAKGVWRQSVLTAYERANIKLVAYSADAIALPNGWSCDAKKNKFTLGLSSEYGKAGASTKKVRSAQSDKQVEYIKRYLRVDSSASLETVRFMAQTLFAGKLYTTCNDARENDSSVLITPTAPVRLKVADLDREVIYRIFSDKSVEIDLYQWKPKNSAFFFITNKGFDSPVPLINEGDYFQSSFVHGIPGSPKYGVKGGTVVKALGTTLYMNDVHKGIPLSEPNPILPFKASVMSALKVAGLFSYDTSDTKSVWRLIDNYGSEQTYKLAPLLFENLDLHDYYEHPQRRLAHFEIKLASGHTPTQALYASGHNQCKVYIEAIVESREIDGSWTRVSLSGTERESATVTFFSSNPHEPLSKGWVCDKEKNAYDAGLLRTPHNTTSAATERIDNIERYLRVYPGAIETQRFMARITVEGVTYTTNFSQGSQFFSSFIIVRPTRPYALRRVDLVEHYHRAYRDESINLTVHVYYYTAPSSIRLIENLGVSKPLFVSSEGRRFRTAALTNGISKVGTVMQSDVPGQSVYLHDIHMQSPTNPRIPFSERQTLLRIVMLYYNKIVGDDVPVINYVTFRDSSGCDHRFRLILVSSYLPLLTG